MDLTPDFRLFCLALQGSQRSDDVEALRQALEVAPNWEAILEGARRHAVAPLILAGLKACDSPEVPAQVITELRRQTLYGAQRSLAQVAQIRRLCRAFAEAHIRVLVFKGVALSVQLYGDICKRGAAVDIDLLVDPHQLSSADRVLVQAGFRQASPAQTPRQCAAYLRLVHHIGYHHVSTGLMVELHHRLTDNPNLLGLKFETLWSDCEEVQLGNFSIPTLSRRHLPLYLCVHGGGHAWERLRWLVDFAKALQEPATMEATLQAAEIEALNPALWHALILAHDWLALPVDEHRLATARACAQVKRLDRLLAHLYAGEAWHETPRWGSWKWQLRHAIWRSAYKRSLKRDWRYWTSQICRQWLWCPADWEIIRLPDTFFWLYPAMRPMGWLVRRLRARHVH